MDAGGYEARDSGCQCRALPRMPSKRLDQKGRVLFEKPRQLKNERSDYRFTVSSRRNEIDALLSSEENV